jgi:hypothetical protein
MQNYFLALIFMILYSLSVVKSVFIVLDPFEKRCVYKDILHKATFTGNYFISGEQEDKNEVTIISPKNVILFRKENQKSGSFSVNTEMDGNYALCFKINTSMHMTVSFDFHDETKDEQLISVSNFRKN